MKINRKLNTFTHSEYVYLLEHYKKYTDFNTLGLFRAIIENEKLALPQKIQIRDLAIAAFSKPFEFLQLKDPDTYFRLCVLGKELTVADQQQAWRDIRINQQRILKSKHIKHRNFGIYSKHECGYETCHLNGLMIRQGSLLAYGGDMYFCSDARRKHVAPEKAEKRKQDRKARKKLIAARVEEE